jgi:hypothetical protein
MLPPVILAWPFLLLSLTAVDDDPSKQDASAAAQQYKQLVDEFEAADRRPAEFAPRFIKFAEEHSEDPTAVDALVWVVANRRYRPEATRAIRLLQEQQLQSERLADACQRLARVVSPDTEQLLRSVIEHSPHARVRAHASFHLAELLAEQVRLAGQLAKDPAVRPRVQQYYGKELTEHLVSLDVEKVEGQREQLYERIAQSFRNVSTRDGPMGELADKALFAIRHLSIGKRAPEIEAEDIDGNRFRLSDYRGNIVVLSFWGHW